MLGLSRIFPFIPIARTVRRIRRDRSNIKVELRQMWSQEQIAALESGALDLGFVHYTDDYRNRTRRPGGDPIAEEAVTAAIPEDTALRRVRQIALAELANEDFVMTAPTKFGETVYDQVIAALPRSRALRRTSFKRPPTSRFS